MKPVKTSTTIYIERDGQEIELSVTGNYTPGHPGRFSGLPENSTPPEGAEVDVTSVTGPDGKPFVFLSEEEENTTYEKAEEYLLEAGADDSSDEDEPDYDDDDEPDYDRDMYQDE